MRSHARRRRIASYDLIAHALGERREPAQRCPLARSMASEPYIVEAWTAEPADVEALARRLAPAS